MTHILIPREPDPALLRPFIGCHAQELREAYAAMVRIAEVQHARAGSQCLAQIEEPAQHTRVVLDDGWKARMLDGRAIARDEMGLGDHPELPLLDEGMMPRSFFAALGLELAHTSAEDQLDWDVLGAMSEAVNWADWLPTPPQGDGWKLVSIFDTEDGPVAWWLRELPEAEDGTTTIRILQAEVEKLKARVARAGAAPAARKVFLVATGETSDGAETYTRHDDAPPPMCDAECLYTAPAAPAAVAGPVLDVTLDEDQAGLLRDMLGDHAEYPEAITVRLMVGDGHSGLGLYVAQAEYQDEGAVLLASLPAPAAPSAVAGRTVPRNDDERAAAQFFADNPSAALLAWPLYLARDKSPALEAPAAETIAEAITNNFRDAGWSMPSIDTARVLEAVKSALGPAAAPQAPAAPSPVAGDWDGKLPEQLQRALNALRLECPPAVVADVEHEVRSCYEALHTSLATTRRMYGAARDRLEALDAAQPDPFAPAQAAPAAPVVDAQGERDAAFEAVRQRLCKVPRWSFHLDSRGNIRRVDDASGNWIEFSAAHELFDPVAVDSALAAQAAAKGAGDD